LDRQVFGAEGDYEKGRAFSEYQYPDIMSEGKRMNIVSSSSTSSSQNLRRTASEGVIPPSRERRAPRAGRKGRTPTTMSEARGARSRSGSPSIKIKKHDDLKKIKKTGKLRKRGDTWTSRAWRERFVILHGEELLWYKSKKEKKPQNSLDLLDPSLKMKLGNGELKIQNSKKTYYFRADSNEELEKWHKELLDVRKNGVPIADDEEVESKTSRDGGEMAVEEPLTKREQQLKMLTEGEGFGSIGLFGGKKFIWFPNNLNRILWGSSKKSAKGFIMVHEMISVIEDIKQDKEIVVTITSESKDVSFKSLDIPLGKRWAMAIREIIEASRKGL